MGDNPPVVVDGNEAKNLSRSEQRKKNRQENKGKKTEPTGEPSVGLWTRIHTFFVEAKEELLKVVWPTRKETFDTTWRLLILVIIAGLYLGLIDGILSRLLRLIV